MGLKNTRAGNYPEWYQNVISEADMAENSSSPGCMVIKPWGYGIWERIRDVLDEKIKGNLPDKIAELRYVRKLLMNNEV